jgi:hypothetical protein
MKAEKSFRATIEEAGGTVVGEYKNAKTPVACICSEGHECSPTPTHVKNNGWCQECAGNSSKATEIKFAHKVVDLGGTMIGTYKNNKTRVLCVCSDGHLCLPMPSFIFKGFNLCRECSGLSSLGDGQTKAISENKFIKAIQKQGGTLLDKYVRNTELVRCRCPNGHECFSDPGGVKRGINMCNICPRELSAQKFKERIALRGGIVVGKYVNILTHVTCECENGHTCEVRPADLSSHASFCRECVGTSAINGKQNLELRLKFRNYVLVGDYKNHVTAVQVKCDKGHIFKRNPSSFQKSHGGICPICFPKHAGQTKVGTALEALHLEFEPEFRFTPCLWRFDFELRLPKILIEFDGEQHFKICTWRPTSQDLQNGQQRDRDKMDLAFEHGYRMIRFDYSWTCRDSSDIQSAIMHCLQQMENDNILLVVSNPDRYGWLLTSHHFVPTCANLQLENEHLFSTFVITH